MEYEVYADLLFLVNFSMDFLCFFLTARILRRRLRPVLAVAGSAVGGIYSVVSLFLPFGPVLSLFADIISCALICAICFASRGHNLKQYASELFVYLASAATLGGLMSAIFNLLNRLNLPISSGNDSISSWLFLFLAAASGIIAMRGSGILRRIPIAHYADTEIVLFGKSVTLHSLTDTGNVLRDPISGRSVIITDVRSTLPILPEPLSEAIVSGKLDLLGSLPPEISGRIRLIPSETVSGSDLLIGIIPDKITIHTEKSSTDQNALIAPASVKSLPDGCEAIIPAELNS